MLRLFEVDIKSLELLIALFDLMVVRQSAGVDGEVTTAFKARHVTLFVQAILQHG